MKILNKSSRTNIKMIVPDLTKALCLLYVLLIMFLFLPFCLAVTAGSVLKVLNRCSCIACDNIMSV